MATFADFAEYALDQVGVRIQGNIDEMQRVAVAAATAEANSMFKYLALAVRGGLSGPPPGLSEFQSSWANFSPSYAKRKGRLDFFDGPKQRRGSGVKLSTVLNQARPSKVYGDPEVKRHKPLEMTFSSAGGGKITVEITLFPHLSGEVTNRDLSWLLASTISDKGKTFGKLMNTGAKTKLNAPERPLLLPALLYFAKTRIPDAVIRGLRTAGFRVNT